MICWIAVQTRSDNEIQIILMRHAHFANFVSIVGAVVATEIYATAVELGAEGVELLADHAEDLMKGTVELLEEHIPEKLDEVKGAFNEFIKDAKLSFNL